MKGSSQLVRICVDAGPVSEDVRLRWSGFVILTAEF